MAGRPKSMETRKIVSLPDELARAIEDYRFTNRLKTEAEAIRRLIERGLTAQYPVDQTRRAGIQSSRVTGGA
jgi:hypothetical protein